MTHSQESDETLASTTEPASPAPVETTAEGAASAQLPVPVPSPASPSPAAFAARPKATTAPAPAPAPPVPEASAAAAPVPAAPVPAAPVPAAPAAPVPAAATAVNMAEAAKFGRAEDDGHVFLLLDGEEFPVGQYPGASKDEALAYFARKFDDILAQLTLLEQRVEAKAPTTDMNKSVAHLREQLGEKTSVGDVNAALARLATLEENIKALAAGERASHEAARAVELAAREAIVAEAENLAAADPATVQWKVSSARMNELFETWKQAQKSGMRLGRATEEGLWKRFRSARTVFDRHRRAYFSQLDNNNAVAKNAKEALIEAAEELSTSTEWGWAAGEYRSLMDQWKASPRASRKDDDALWARFRGAQDKFFTARQSANNALDEEFGANLIVKEALIVEAQALLPVKDLNATKKALQSIRDRWEEAGKVPRSDMQRVEAGLRKVEDTVRSADEDNWRRSDPEAKARTSSALSQLEATIAGLKDDLAKAQKAGDARKVAKATEALEARELWLKQIEKAAADFS